MADSATTTSVGGPVGAAGERRPGRTGCASCKQPQLADGARCDCDRLRQAKQQQHSFKRNHMNTTPSSRDDHPTSDQLLNMIAARGPPPAETRRVFARNTSDNLNENNRWPTRASLALKPTNKAKAGEPRRQDGAEEAPASPGQQQQQTRSETKAKATPATATATPATELRRRRHICRHSRGAKSAPLRALISRHLAQVGAVSGLLLLVCCAAGSLGQLLAQGNNGQLGVAYDQSTRRIEETSNQVHAASSSFGK